MPSDPALLEQVRRDRNERGLTLGELVDKYGATAVVDAFGVMGTAYLLGVYPEPYHDDVNEDA